MSTSRRPEPPGHSEAAIRALARDLAELRTAVDELREQTSAASEGAAAAVRAAATLTDTVEKIRTRTAASAAESQESDVPAHAVRSGVTPPPGDGTPAEPWWTVSDADIAQARLSDLVDWIESVYVRYLDSTTELTPCWAYHADVVTELLTLRDTWHAVYYGPAASPQAVQDWHDRYRPGTVQRVTAVLRGCGLAKHSGQSYKPPRTPGAEAIGTISSWWSDTHGTSAPPPPTPDLLASEQASRSAADATDY